MARLIRYVNTASTFGGDGTTNSTVGDSRAFASLREAFLAISQDLTAVEPDDVVVKGYLVTDIALEIICDNAGGPDTSPGGVTRTNNFAGICDPSHRVLIRAADNSWHDQLKFDTGYALKYSTSSGFGALTVDNTGIGSGCLVVMGIQFENTNVSPTRHGLLEQSAAGSVDGPRNYYIDCLAKCPSGDAFRSVSNCVVFINCRGSASFGNGFTVSSSAHNNGLRACLADGNTGFGFSCSTASDASLDVHNCVAVSNTSGDWTTGPIVAESASNNASSDATAPGTDPVLNVSTLDGVDFESPSTGDFRIVIGGALNDAGADLVALGLLSSNVDAVGTSRPQDTNWDIGPLERTSDNPVIVLGTANLTITGFAPHLQGTTIQPGTASLSLQGFALSVTQQIRKQPGTATLTITGEPPNVQGSGAVRPNAATLTIQGFAPIVREAHRIQLDTAILSVQGIAPQVFTPGLIVPPTGTLSLTGFQSHQTLTLPSPEAAQLTLTGFAPNFTILVRKVPDTANLAIQGFAPRVSQNIRIVPGTETLTITGAEPVETVNIVIRPPSGTLQLSGQVPFVQGVLRITPPTGALTITGVAPALTGENIIRPPTATLTVTGAALSVRRGTVIRPPTGALTLSGQTANVRVPIIIRPPTGQLLIEGQLSPSGGTGGGDGTDGGTGIILRQPARQALRNPIRIPLRVFHG